MPALVAAVLAVYGQTLGFGFIGFNDPGYVYNNPHVRAGLTLDGIGWAFTTFQQANWHPLTWLSLLLCCHCTSRWSRFLSPKRI